MNLLFVSPTPNSYVKTLTLHGMIFGGGGLWEVMRGSQK